MLKALITQKIGMATIVTDDGSAKAVTLLSVGPQTVTQLKDTETDGYQAVQIGAGNAKLGKSSTGHFKKAKTSPKTVKEFRVEEASELSVGDSFGSEVFEVGDQINVTALSKGKGWAGTIKRHNFKRGRKTHGGQSYRRPGSIGSMYPQRIFPGKKMAGQMGYEQVTVRNLKVALIDNELNVIGVFGAVPGPKKGTVIVRGV